MVSSGKTRRRRPGVPLAVFIILMTAATVPVTAADTDAVLAETVTLQQDQQTAGTIAEGTQEEGPEAPDSPRVVIVLEHGGEIVMELMPKEAPLAVERFTMLVKEGFYDGMKFHRVESWLIQTGKMETELEPIEGEMFFQNLKHDKGMVGMARFPDDYDSASTQFYILKECKNALNGEYTIFACVVEGMDVVMGVKKGDKIKEVRFVE